MLFYNNIQAENYFVSADHYANPKELLLALYIASLHWAYLFDRKAIASDRNAASSVVYDQMIAPSKSDERTGHSRLALPHDLFFMGQIFSAVGNNNKNVTESVWALGCRTKVHFDWF